MDVLRLLLFACFNVEVVVDQFLEHWFRRQDCLVPTLANVIIYVYSQVKGTYPLGSTPFSAYYDPTSGPGNLDPTPNQNI